MLPLWLMLSCANPSSDRVAYTRACAHPDDPALCAPIRDAGLRGECVTMAIRKLAHAGDEVPARQTCEAMAPGMWRDECWFVLSDALRASGDQCAELCQRSARYRKMCLDHCTSRQVHDILERATAGDEATTLAELTAALRLQTGPDRAAAQAQRLMDERSISPEPTPPPAP